MSELDMKTYEEERKRYQEAWSFLIPRFAPGWHWYQQLSAGTGWRELVEKLVSELDFAWNGWLGKEGSSHWQLLQCKEKFGGLRFYTKLVGDGDKESEDYRKRAEKFEKAVSRWEGKSFSVCETCGKDGKLRSVGGWLGTVCQEDYDAWLKRRVNEEQRHPEHATLEEDLIDDIERERRKGKK